MNKCNLKKLMLEKGISIKELAVTTNLSEKTIKLYYENKIKILKFETLNKLCKALNCGTNDLLEKTSL